LQTVVQKNSPDSSPQNTNSYSYDNLGNLTGLTDENGHTTQNAFDVLREPVKKTLPDNTLYEARAYDADGNLYQLTHFNGVTTTYTYDALNRLLSRATPGEATVSFTYKPNGQRATMTDASGQTTYTYDSLNRLITKVTPQGTLTYTYYPTGRVNTVTSSNANGVSVSYTYDDLNRLSTVVDNRLTGQNTTTYAYDPASNLATATYPSGLKSTFTYDALNRLTALSTPVSSYSYTLGPTGNRTNATEGTGRTLVWSYDNICRLTNEAITADPSNNNDGSVSYSLDPVGNRTSDTSSLAGVSPQSATYNPDDQLSTETYDNNGNTTGIGVKSFTYDAENHMVSMTNGGTSVTMLYDGDGNRVAKTVGSVTTRYLIDTLNPTGYPQVVEETVNGVVQRQYTYGHQRISENLNPVVTGNSAWTPSFYEYDGGGSVRQLTNFAGHVTDSYEYDAFGNQINPTSTTPNNYLYRGEQYDSDLGLYYLRARYYNPATGRFLSRDPANGIITDPKTLHKYSYAGGDPVNALDPSGREAMAEVAQIDWGSVLKDSFAVTAVAVGAVCLLNEAKDLVVGAATDLGTPVQSITFGVCEAEVKKKCKPCDPPAGTRCYVPNSGHPHPTSLGWDPHYHIWNQGQNPDTCQCFWRENHGSNGTYQFPPLGLYECSYYPSWPAN
jgi:RHS repeat-associated protein